MDSNQENMDAYKIHSNNGNQESYTQKYREPIGKVKNNSEIITGL